MVYFNILLDKNKKKTLNDQTFSTFLLPKS